MAKRYLVAALCAWLMASPAMAQQTYPTVRAPDRVPGEVPLQCDASGTHCAPITAANPLQVVTAAGGTAQGASSSGVTGGMVQGVATTAAPSYSNATVNPFSFDLAGNLRVSSLTALPAGSAIIGKVGIDQTTPGTTNLVSIGTNASTNEAQINGVTPLMGNGVTGTGSQRVTIASDNTAFPVNATLAAGSALAGKVGIDQTTSGTTNLVATISGQNGLDGGSGNRTAKTARVADAGMEYETIAASQTAQVMGATGATGDYLSHCILQPTTTAAGTFTISDNATVLFTYTTGTLSDLRPIIIPMGLTSVSGAWKITTAANETAICIGDFL